MRIAVLADIHGNLAALNAVLDDARVHGAEQFILAGDYIFDLPWSNEVTETIQSLESAAVILGNKEGYLPGLLSEHREGWVYEQFGSMVQTVRDMKPENAEYLLNLPQSATALLPSGRKVYIRHWFSEFGISGKTEAISAKMFREATQNRSFDRDAFMRGVHDFLQRPAIVDMVSAIDADAVVFGHTHLQWHGTCGGKLVLNPGSCGQPLDGDNHSAYTLLTDTSEGLLVEERRVSYDVESVIRKAKQSAVYRQGRVWVELVFAAMRSGFDTFGPFFGLAEKLANERGQSGIPYSNEVWNLSYERYWAGERA
ncbi:MAG: metallophosphatase family protein [Oscillospiraceae bacterium]|nr:metallophosphatase family protein [Oscillospiraceae bacterium]